MFTGTAPIPRGLQGPPGGLKYFKYFKDFKDFKDPGGVPEVPGP
jgi:hypothetical protein